jgi:hypothetical protein
VSRYGLDVEEQLRAPSMDPQPFCALPDCGKAPGGPMKVRIVDGKRLEYPDGIDAHHPFGRPGPVVYFCHACHMAHHDGRRRDVYHDGERWRLGTSTRQGVVTRSVPLVIAAEWDH